MAIRPRRYQGRSSSDGPQDWQRAPDEQQVASGEKGGHPTTHAETSPRPHHAPGRHRDGTQERCHDQVLGACDEQRSRRDSRRDIPDSPHELLIQDRRHAKAHDRRLRHNVAPCFHRGSGQGRPRTLWHARPSTL